MSNTEVRSDSSSYLPPIISAKIMEGVLEVGVFHLVTFPLEGEVEVILEVIS